MILWSMIWIFKWDTSKKDLDQLHRSIQMDRPWLPQLQCQEAPLQLHHLEQGVSLQPTQPAKKNPIAQLLRVGRRNWSYLKTVKHPSLWLFSQAFMRRKNHNLLKTTKKKKKNTKLVIFGYGRTGTRSITSTFTLVGKEYMFYFIIINQWARNKCCNSIISTHTVVRSKKN